MAVNLSFWNVTTLDSTVSLAENTWSEIHNSVRKH